eukprot:1430827-Pyramimonas_sp.AAC.1
MPARAPARGRLRGESRREDGPRGDDGLPTNCHPGGRGAMPHGAQKAGRPERDRDADKPREVQPPRQGRGACARQSTLHGET